MTEPSHTISIAQLLRDTVASKPIGQGGYAKAYDFPDYAPELRDYVLRVSTKKKLDEILEGSTALTPVKHLVANRNIGQSLMTLGEDEQITIHLRQQGQSLAPLGTLWQHHRGNPAYFDKQAIVKTMETITTLRDDEKNPFLSVLKQAYHLTLSGYEPDVNFDNIFLDETHHCLQLIDQTQKRIEGKPVHRDGIALMEALSQLMVNQLGRLGTRLSIAPGTPIDDRFLAASEQLKHMIASATEQARRDVRNEVPEKSIAFATVTNTQAIIPSQGFHVLTQRLKEYRREANASPVLA